VTFVIVMFVLLMLFLWKYIDDLIGKGFEWYVIAELMLYASATNVQMALPLSVLLSSIMTYGSLGENYELVAIKSAGISLTRAMYPMLVTVVILGIGAFFFSDYMLPKANLKYYSLLWDAREQKSANFLPEGVFSSSFPEYTIRVDKKDEDGQTLHGLTIYFKGVNYNDEPYVMKARKGRMVRSNDNKYLIIYLEDGIRYIETRGDKGFNPQPRQILRRERFSFTQNKFKLEGLGFKRTDEKLFQSAFQMMSRRLLIDTISKINRVIDSGRRVNMAQVSAYVKYFNMPLKPLDSTVKVEKFSDGVMSFGNNVQKSGYITNGQGEARNVLDLMKHRADSYKEASFSSKSASVEYQKKFTLSAACLVLFLIGAPLGAIIRKGGLGLPVVVSVVFFLIYHIISTIGEKAVKAGDASPFVGMWIAIVLLTPIGLFLSYKAANDSVIFDADLYKKFFNNTIGRILTAFKSKVNLAGKSVE
jgi:lipopolysaccharide export system permease protein